MADSFGEGFLLTEALAQQARAEGISFVVSPDALNARKIRSLYFPATGTFVAVGEGEAESKRINMKRFIDPEKEKETRRLNRLFRKGCRLLLDDATEAFASARTRTLNWRTSTSRRWISEKQTGCAICSSTRSSDA